MASLHPQQQATNGISTGLVRLSIGIETRATLLANIAQTLEKSVEE